MKIVGRRQLNRGKRESLKETPGETARSIVSLRHVDVPDAELRLEQALELLLGEAISLDEIVEGEEPHQNKEGSASGRSAT